MQRIKINTEKKNNNIKANKVQGFRLRGSCQGGKTFSNGNILSHRKAEEQQ